MTALTWPFKKHCEHDDEKQCIAQRQVSAEGTSMLDVQSGHAVVY